MAVEAGLGCAVASALAVICVDGEVEIHDFAFELDGREGVRGHGDRERVKEVLCGEVDMEMDYGGTGTLSTLVRGEIWITSGIDSSSARLFESSSRKRSLCDPAL